MQPVDITSPLCVLLRCASRVQLIPLHRCHESEVVCVTWWRVGNSLRAYASPLIVRYMFIHRVIMSHKLVNRVTMYGSYESILFGRLQGARRLCNHVEA